VANCRTRFVASTAVARRHSNAVLKKNCALIPVVPIMMVIMMMVVGVVSVVMTVIVGIVSMMMMIAVPSRGWSRAADGDCADNAQCRSNFRYGSHDAFGVAISAAIVNRNGPRGRAGH
jgi:hypothetical protein